jgi:hypothetical protein
MVRSAQDYWTGSLTMFKLHQVVPWGRFFEEYRRIFSLTEAHLRRCGARRPTRGHAGRVCDDVIGSRGYPPPQGDSGAHRHCAGRRPTRDPAGSGEHSARPTISIRRVGGVEDDGRVPRREATLERSLPRPGDDVRRVIAQERVRSFIGIAH